MIPSWKFFSLCVCLCSGEKHQNLPEKFLSECESVRKNLFHCRELLEQWADDVVRREEKSENKNNKNLTRKSSSIATKHRVQREITSSFSLCWVWSILTTLTTTTTSSAPTMSRISIVYQCDFISWAAAYSSSYLRCWFFLIPSRLHRRCVFITLFSNKNDDRKCRASKHPTKSNCHGAFLL